MSAKVIIMTNIINKQKIMGTQKISSPPIAKIFWNYSEDVAQTKL